MSDLALPHIARLHAYTPGMQPGEEGWVKLNTNECPYPPSPRVAEALRNEIGSDGARLRLYPNPKSDPLRHAVARHHGLSAANVCIGNGSDDILNLLVRCFCGPASAAGFTWPSYSLYPVLVGIQDGAVELVEFSRSMELPVDRIARSKARIFFLTSPNAPTGVGFGTDDVARAARAFPGILVVDEAYAPFAAANAVELVQRHERLVVVRTFSKAYALAGMRVGYALASAGVIDLIDRVRDSYNVGRLAQVAAEAALADPAYYSSVIARICSTRDRFIAGLKGTRGWFTYPSQANFVFTEPRTREGESGAAVAKALWEFLHSRRVLVRHFPSSPLTAPFLRISVGTDDEMRVLNQELDEWQKAPQLATRQ